MFRFYNYNKKICCWLGEKSFKVYNCRVEYQDRIEFLYFCSSFQWWEEIKKLLMTLSSSYKRTDNNVSVVTFSGVDWKSLTIPACLPITTDYFPDDICLKTDYLFSDYNLLPDDVNADYAQQRAVYRKPLTTQEVFRELVSQRLSQVSCSNRITSLVPSK